MLIVCSLGRDYQRNEKCEFDLNVCLPMRPVFVKGILRPVHASTHIFLLMAEEQG